mgnify:CR=1 FL=1
MPKLKPPFKLNVPMLLTWMRIAMIPLVIGIFYLPETWMTMGTKNATAMLMFVIAAITDALDPAAIRAGPRPWAPSSIPSPTSSS